MQTKNTLKGQKYGKNYKFSAKNVNFSGCMYNSENFAQREQNFALAHACVPVTFRNSAFRQG